MEIVDKIPVCKACNNHLPDNYEICAKCQFAICPDCGIKVELKQDPSGFLVTCKKCDDKA